MVSRNLGGVEQAFLDYYHALAYEGHQVFNIASSFAKVNNRNVSLSYAAGFKKLQ